jgi:SAM-dependent methyltransferase
MIEAMMVRRIVSLGVVAVAVPYVLNQVRKPSRWIGRMFLWSMNRSHSALTNWGLGQVTIGEAFTFLDVGCGGGRTIQKLAAVASAGKVYGIDYSAESVAVSRATNAAAIAAGRVEIQEASVSRLPFADGTFDLVTAVETHYYWRNLIEDTREIRRVLKPGGELIIVAETYRRKHDPVYRLAMKALRAAHLTADEHRELLAAAGFEQVRIVERKNGWICAKGVKPAAA